MFAAALLVFAIPLLGIFAAPVAEDDLVVQLAQPQSKIRGQALSSAKGIEYYAFQEIPYAEPPTGQNRFKPPIPHNGWEGILNTTQNTKKCYQTQNKNMTVRMKDDIDSMTESEDCLFLNVYTPVKPGSDNSLSVYLFVHGGAFSGGDGGFQGQGPKYLMDGNIIVVTINYRLGPWGFLSTGDTVISGNMGLKDQLRAVEWTRDNIHLFGGNPKDIVVGGQSAGSFSMGYHLLNPKSKGLISGFIQESGSPLGIGAFIKDPRTHAMDLGRALDSSFDIDDSDTLVSVLQKASAEDIVEAFYKIPLSTTTPTAFGPVLEDVNSDQPFATVPMHQAFMDGDMNDIPILIGFNSEEGAGMSSDADLTKNAVLYDSRLDLLVDAALNVENRTLVGMKLREAYTKEKTFSEDLYACLRYHSDRDISMGVIRQAELASKKIPVYLYQFSAGDTGRNKYPGISHGGELSYIFDSSGPGGFGPGPDPVQVNETTREVVLTLWWNFIKNKNPTPTVDPLLNSVEWPRVQPGSVTYLNINETLSVETNPRNYENVRDVLLPYLRPPYYLFFGGPLHY